MPRDGIILLAKQSGMTSFASLWQIKNALGTKKIGHTGTLDTFAEGLLVALSGRLTRLVPYITDCDKEYEAIVSFGSETDTLDPDGTVITTGPLPAYGDVIRALRSFTGRISQVPPAYSAIHVDGRRASDLARSGIEPDISPRHVIIHSVETLYACGDDPDRSIVAHPDPDMTVSAVAIRVSCSKGTYIRSLARDIARAAGSCARLGALRRTRIGPFSLGEAAGFRLLAPFGTVPPAAYGQGDKPPQADAEEILASVLSFTPELARAVGLSPVFLDPGRLSAFFKGQKPSPDWFDADRTADPDCRQDGNVTSVFCGAEFAGAVHWFAGVPRYAFVAGGPA